MTLSAIILSTLLSQELECLAKISYYEQRSDQVSYAAKVAPAIVARNRVLSEDFPNTFCEVMNQDRQFAFVTNNLHLQEPANPEAWDVAQQIAVDVMNMPVHAYERPLQNSLYFHSGSFPDWNLNKIEKTVEIGGQKFYADIN